MPTTPRPVLVRTDPDDEDDPRAPLRRAASRARSATKALEESIATARAAGLSWDQIAAATGLNRETLRRKHPDA